MGLEFQVLLGRDIGCKEVTAMKDRGGLMRPPEPR